MVGGMLSGMTKKGFVSETQQEFEFRSIPVTKIMGEFPLGEDLGKYTNETYMIFTSDSTYAVSFNWHDSVSRPSFGDEILERLNYVGRSPELERKNPASSKSPAFEFGEKVGEFTVYALLTIVVVGSLLRLKKKKS